MKFFPTPRRIAFAMLAAGALALMAGCATKSTSVDAKFRTLEGTPNSDARLVVWQEAPDTLVVWMDLGGVGPSTDPDNEPDTIFARPLNYRTGPGTLYTMLLDRTNANGFQLYRTASNGGYEAVTDYTISPLEKWLSNGWELYSLIDRHPSSYSPPTYQARGLLGGTVTASSPLSNRAQSLTEMPKQSIRFLAPTAPADSLFPMQWTPVSGAAGYWIDVYQFKNTATVDEKIASGTPSPVWDGHVTHYFVGYVPGGATSYKLGDPGADVVTLRAPIRGQEYLVRITAVNSEGSVIGWMSGSSGRQQLDGTYRYYPLGAQAVTPAK